MNLTCHIVKKDLRALRWPLVVWVALIAAKLVMGVMLLTSDTTGDTELFETLNGLSKLLAGLEFLGIVLVAVLIQEDMLVGTTAFWVTRPISGARLLAAKLLGLGVVFVVLPVLVTLPWWLGCHLSLGAMVGAALETIGLHLLVVVLGLLMATVTDGLGRFMLWVVALLAAIPLLGASIAFCLSRMNAVVPSDLATTRLALGAGVALLGAAVVIIHQFLTRRIWRSVSMIGATLAVVVLIELVWPFSWRIDSHWNSFLAHQAEQAWPAGTAPAGLTFTTTGAEIRRRADAKPDRPVQLWVNCLVGGVPADQMLVPAVSNYTLSWADGVTDEGWSGFHFDRSFDTLLTRRKLDLTKEEFKRPAFVRATQVIPARIANRLAQEPAVYTLQTRFSLVAVGTIEPVPSAPGRRVVYGVVGERVAGVEKEGEVMAVTLVRHRPALISYYLAEMGSYVLGAGTNWSPPTQYVLMSKAGDVLDAGDGGPMRTSRVASVEVTWETRTYRAMKANGSAKPRWEAIEALEAADLTRVSYRSLGSFTQTIKVDPMVVSAPARN